jgi:hypothetical protein
MWEKKRLKDTDLLFDEKSLKEYHMIIHSSSPSSARLPPFFSL